MNLTNTEKVFFALLRAGLWEKEVRLDESEAIDFNDVYRLAEEQTVIGLIAAGLEHLEGADVPIDVKVEFISAVTQLESRNVTMNGFIEELLAKMYKVGIYTLLIKGQGIAQCYERPLWRSPGDVDLFLDGENYDKAKKWFGTIGQLIGEEDPDIKHILLSVDSWDVELHGTQRGDVSGRIDCVIDELQEEIFKQGRVRRWQNGSTDVLIPAPDDDVIIVFAHILHHFFHGGIGLKQVCDWCRFLWTYKDSLNHDLLENRLQKMKVMTEWHAFAAFAVDTLGMPKEAMPLYSSAKTSQRKAIKIRDYILETGNFGYNRDLSYFNKYPYFTRKIISFYRRTYDFAILFSIFPKNASSAYWDILKEGFTAVADHLFKRK